MGVRVFDFRQVDVFTSKPLKGNPLAVVIGADALSDDEMATFANWTNLSETTFLLKPTKAEADYRVRIFTPSRELPFAGHPTLGSCHVWLDSHGKSDGSKSSDGEVVQECAAGLIRIRRDGARLAFAAPPLLKSGPLEPELVEQVRNALHLESDVVIDAQWVDNGPGWLGLLLKSRKDVLTLTPDYALLAGLRVGVVAPWDSSEDGRDADFELRAFTSGGYEDPVTGSFNAGVAQWLIGANIAPSSYIASQGTVLGRAGRIHVEKIGTDVWIGGHVTRCIEGTVSL
ncbi:PhzF family phenazine biosynthesis protein [Brucella sp. BE17]|uniref:PhzF family phenazine biosynthesis protein n=1 Tax=Brucella sp. BE17 TaxID=3142977 RepID=UPI0031BAF922